MTLHNRSMMLRSLYLIYSIMIATIVIKFTDGQVVY
jgi:hypothetical protein